MIKINIISGMSEIQTIRNVLIAPDCHSRPSERSYYWIGRCNREPFNSIIIERSCAD